MKQANSMIRRGLALAVFTPFATFSLANDIEAPIFEIPLPGSGHVDIAITSICDLNYDGVDEILVGLPNINTAAMYSGKDGCRIWGFVGPAGSEFGFSVAAAGALNDEFFIGAPAGGFSNNGSVYHFTITPPPPQICATVTCPLVQVIALPTFPGTGPIRFGHSITSLGDVFGGAEPEVAIGAPLWSNILTGVSQTGLVRVMDTSPIATVGPFNLTGTSVGERFGTDLASTPLNMMQQNLLAIGSPALLPGQTEGFISLIDTAALPTFPMTLPLPVAGLIPWGGFGTALADLGDIDGDGISDFGIGAPGPVFNDGIVYSLDGAAAAQYVATSGIPPVPAPYTQVFSQCHDDGQDVTQIGDYNGDGLADMLVGAPANGTCGSVGRAYVFSPARGKIVDMFGASGMTSSFGRAVTGVGRFCVTDGQGLAVADPGAGKVFVY